METKCTQCNEIKPISEFYFRNDTGKYRKQCKDCRKRKTSEWVRNNPEIKKATYRAYYDKNREKLIKNSVEWGRNNPEKRQKYCMSWRWKLRLEIIIEYGGKCTCCGESQPEFLTIDHINDNGGKMRRENKELTGGSFYRWLKKQDFPKENFQLLCMNCNFAKGHFGGCPHND